MGLPRQWVFYLCQMQSDLGTTAPTLQHHSNLKDFRKTGLIWIAVAEKRLQCLFEGMRQDDR